MASMSINGVVSGMDWESMIDEIITNAAKPAQVQVAKKTDLTNKKSLFEEMKVMVNSISSSMSALKLPSTYKAKEIEIENLGGTGSYKSVLTATVNADAEVNVWNVKVNQLASAQINRSKQITDSSLASTLSGVSGSTLYINAGGQKVGVEVKATDTLDSLKSRINTTLKTLDNPLHVTASVVDNKLILKSDYTGLGAFTSHETINYNSLGVNTLTGFSVTEGTESNVKITNGSTTYTYGTDFTIANQNEIRWKQYDRSNEVALGDTVTVKYTMNQDDVYTKTGTYGGTEASISRFTMTDNGTLSKRVKIVGTDEDGNQQTYTYGKDFTITNNKVVWLEEEEAKTNEPSSYTVSYSKTNTVAYSTGNVAKDETSTTYTDEPDAYIVRYDDKATGSYDVNQSKTSSYNDPISIDYDKMCELYKNTTGSDLLVTPIVVSSTNTSYFLDPPDRSAFSITTVDGTTYEYGKDFVLRTTNNTSDTSSGNWQITWGGGNVVTAYANAKGISGTNTEKPSSGTSITLSMSYDYDYTRTARVSASDNDKLLTTVFGSDFDMSNFDSSKLTIRGYTYGTDYTVDTDSTSANYGEIQWLKKTSTTPSIDDAIDITNIESAYNTANGTSAIPTVTLTDSNGVLRTYLDPADPSAFTMTSGSDTYEYGRDYVIRVNDDRNGYVISWAITNDSNGDGNTDINDANTAVTTYTQYKGLSTQGMMASPTNGASYGLSFSADYTTTDSGMVSKSATDKSLGSILKKVSVDSSDYATTLTITSGS
ncbi:MAG: hypothetical protein IJT58_06985, partial [Synergistaceae bacterium]|nr:hypothetical protein [Synergistaceae bacterium]